MIRLRFLQISSLIFNYIVYGVAFHHTVVITSYSILTNFNAMLSESHLVNNVIHYFCIQSRHPQLLLLIRQS